APRCPPWAKAVLRSLPALRPRVTSRRVLAFQPLSRWPRRPSVATYSRMCSATQTSGLSMISGSCAGGSASCALDMMSSWSMSPPESTGLDNTSRPAGRFGQRSDLAGAGVSTENGNERRTEMGKIVVSENVSVDGVIEDPAGVEGFRLGGWFWDTDRGEDGEKFTLDKTLGTAALL